MSTTLANLRARVGGPGFCSDMLTGIADSNANTSLIVDAAIGNYPNDTFNYCQVAVTSGTYAGSRRWVSDFATTTGTITVDAAFGGAISTGITYEIHRLFSADDKDSAINQAIRDSHDKWLRHIENTSITIVADTYRYRIDNLTVGVDRTLGIDDIWENDPAEDEWYRVSPDAWRIADSAGTLYLEFDPDHLPEEDQVLRLQYRAFPATLSADASTLDPEETTFINYIAARATGMLFQRKADLGNENTRGHWQNRANQMFQEAELIYGARGHTAPKRAKTVAGW